MTEEAKKNKQGPTTEVTTLPRYVSALRCCATLLRYIATLHCRAKVLHYVVALRCRATF